MIENVMQYSLSDSDKRLFRLGAPKTRDAADTLFSHDSSSIKAWLFLLTGYTAKPLNLRGWNLLNQSLNKGFDLNLNDRELRILSMMDEMLAEVPRFVGVHYVAPQKTDSTAAHTKQVMNIVQHIWQSSGVTGMQQLRRDALLGAWLHDMGEVVLELSTASLMFAMPKNLQDEFKAHKDDVEREVVGFSIALAEKALEGNDPKLFARVIHNLRDDLLALPQGDDLPLRRMRLLTQRITELRQEHQLPATASETAKKLLGVYDRIEFPLNNDFLHPFVKTLEAVEGQRYLQRNGADAAHMALYRRLSPDSMASDLGMHLISDNEIVSACQRCERRLPMLFERAGTREQKLLAREAAKFTYRSLGRQFTPSNEDHVANLPAYIDRQPEQGKDPYAGLTIQELERIRAQEHAYKEQQFGAQDNASFDVRYYSKSRAGQLYQAAHDSVLNLWFAPKHDSLIATRDCSALPLQITARMQRLVQTSRVAQMPSDQGRA